MRRENFWKLNFVLLFSAWMYSALNTWCHFIPDSMHECSDDFIKWMKRSAKCSLIQLINRRVYVKCNQAFQTLSTAEKLLCFGSIVSSNMAAATATASEAIAVTMTTIVAWRLSRSFANDWCFSLNFDVMTVLSSHLEQNKSFWIKFMNDRK